MSHVYALLTPAQTAVSQSLTKCSEILKRYLEQTVGVVRSLVTLTMESQRLNMFSLWLRSPFSSRFRGSSHQHFSHKWIPRG
jgi:hypothetical protein